MPVWLKTSYLSQHVLFLMTFSTYCTLTLTLDPLIVQADIKALKVAFFQKVQIVFHISQKIFQISILNYPEFEI